MYCQLFIVLVIVAVSCNAYSPLVASFKKVVSFSSNTKLYSRHGVKRYHELGVQIAKKTDAEDKNQWEQSKVKWEESGKKAIYEKRRREEDAIRSELNLKASESKAAAVEVVAEVVAEVVETTPEEAAP